ncbi:MAG: phosphotransferase [Patescibacteria group bacterium]
MDEKLIAQARTVAQQFALDAEIKTVESFGQGRINDTFLVTTENGGRYVLQKLHPIFAPSVLEDINVLTQAMKERCLMTTELIPTNTGELGLIAGATCWRMLTFVTGRTIEDGITPDEARSGMELIGNFHQTFAEHNYDFRHVREGFHDTPKIMRGFEEIILAYFGTKKDEALAWVGHEILDEYNSREHAWAHLPKRIVHGDLKLNNIRFANNSSRAIALLDLDTLGRHSVVVDVSDAARSWCNQADEGDARNAKFDLDIFRAMMEGYGRTADFLKQEEREAIPGAIAQIALELSARFATDAYCESYFTLDREHYPDLFTQNSAKARAQFALYQDIIRQIKDIGAIAQSF